MNDTRTTNPTPADTMLHYDYVAQCWVRFGYVEQCGHRVPSPACYACTRAGEHHTCGVGCEPSYPIGAKCGCIGHRDACECSRPGAPTVLR